MSGTEEREEWSVTGISYKFPFWEEKDILKLDRDNNCITLNILKPTKLHTSKGWILWYVKYILIRLLLKKTNSGKRFLRKESSDKIRVLKGSLWLQSESTDLGVEKGGYYDNTSERN